MHFRASVDLAITYTFRAMCTLHGGKHHHALHPHNVISFAPHYDEDVWTLAEQFLIAHNLCNFIELCLCTLLEGNSSYMIYEYEATALQWVRIGTIVQHSEEMCPALTLP